jgi:hypothetical protein
MLSHKNNEKTIDFYRLHAIITVSKMKPMIKRSSLFIRFKRVAGGENAAVGC